MVGIATAYVIHADDEEAAERLAELLAIPPGVLLAARGAISLASADVRAEADKLGSLLPEIASPSVSGGAVYLAFGLALVALGISRL